MKICKLVKTKKFKKKKMNRMKKTKNQILALIVILLNFINPSVTQGLEFTFPLEGRIHNFQYI